MGNLTLAFPGESLFFCEFFGAATAFDLLFLKDMSFHLDVCEMGVSHDI